MSWKPAERKGRKRGAKTSLYPLSGEAIHELLERPYRIAAKRKARNGRAAQRGRLAREAAVKFTVGRTGHP